MLQLLNADEFNIILDYCSGDSLVELACTSKNLYQSFRTLVLHLYEQEKLVEFMRRRRVDPRLNSFIQAFKKQECSVEEGCETG